MADLLQDKVFIFAQNPIPSESEIYFLEMAANEANLGPIKDSEIVSYGDNYDTYKTTTKFGAKVIKLSLDPTSDFSEPEPPNGPKTFAIVNSEIGGTPIVAKIEDYIGGANLSEIGESAIFTIWPKVVESIVQNSQTAANKTLNQHLKELFKKTSIDDDENLDTLVKTNSSNYQLVKSGIAELKQEVQTLCKDWYSSDTLIHGNISLDNLFVSKDKVIFSSWGNSYSANLLLELAALKMNIDFPQEIEYEIFSQLKKQASLIHSWEEYIQCKTFVASYKFLECVYLFIKETFLFEGKRQGEILKLSAFFCRNLGQFNKLAGFRKHQDELLKLFSSPVV